MEGDTEDLISIKIVYVCERVTKLHWKSFENNNLFLQLQWIDQRVLEELDIFYTYFFSHSIPKTSKFKK